MAKHLRVTGVTLLLLGRAVPLAAPPLQRAEAGRLEGIATIATSLTTSRARMRVYEEAGTPPARLSHDDNPMANIVLYLAAAPGLKQAPQPAAILAPELRQHSERFLPHVLPVLVGTTVEFPNDDPLYHNVFSLSPIKSFDLGRYPRGSSRSVRFLKAGVVAVFCHIHADMNGFIVVLDNPFFVTPDAKGHFVLDGIPSGDYQLVAWHERIHPLRVPVHIEAGKTTSLAVRVPLPEPSVQP